MASFRSKRKGWVTLKLEKKETKLFSNGYLMDTMEKVCVFSAVLPPLHKHEKKAYFNIGQEIEIYLGSAVLEDCLNDFNGTKLKKG